MEDLNMPSDVFDPDDIDSPLDPISEPVRITPAPRTGGASGATAASTATLSGRPASFAQNEPTPAQRQIRQRQTAPTATPQQATAATSRPEERRTATPARPQQTQSAGNTPPTDATIASTPRQPLDWTVDLSFFTDGRFSRMAGVTLLFVAVFLLIVSISFFSTGAADQSALGVDGAAVENTGGMMGALVSHALISQWFGLGSFIIIFWIAALGLTFVRFRRSNIIGLSIKSLVSAISLSVVAGYVSSHFTGSFPLGGMHGHYINSIVMGFAGEIGALLLSLLLVAMLAVIFLKEVTAGVKSLITGYYALRRRVASENMLRRMAREEREQRDAEAAARMAQPAATPSAAPSAQPTSAPTAPPEEEAADHATTIEPPTREEIERPIVVDSTAFSAQLEKEQRGAAVAAKARQRDRFAEIEDFEVDDSTIDDSAVGSSVATPIATSAGTTAPATKVATTIPASDAVSASASAAISAETPVNTYGTAASSTTEERYAPASPEEKISDTPRGLDTPLTDLDAESDDFRDDDMIAQSPATETPEEENTVTPVTANDVIRKAPEIKEAEHISRDSYDPTAELSHYRFPSLDILKMPPARERNIDKEEELANQERIKATLSSFGIGITHIESTIGPTVTLYEVIPAEGVKIAKIKSLEEDIARAIAAVGTRIIAPIPGKETVGIEVPNRDPQIVPLRSILASKDYQECHYELPMAMGTTIQNEVYIADLTKMPHLLVAGATGTGKSVGLNVIISSLLYKKHPAELKFVLVDPKMVEFSLYRKLERHYLAKLPDEEEPIITDPHKVVPTLNSLCVEMDNRYRLLQSAFVRSIKEYNNKFTARMLNPKEGHRFLPYIVVVVDEFADLIMMAGKEVEQPIARIAQKARAVGIHLILATQRPSTNVITGIIKANFPGRIAFRVFQMVDSRTILDRPGANQLIGRGDMLFSRDGVIDRVQCALIETEEVEKMCEMISNQVGYDSAYELPEFVPEGSEGSGHGGSLNDTDPLFADAARYVVTANQASTTGLQRRYEIGYPRAGKVMDQLEKAGVVGPAQGSKPRQLLMDTLMVERLLESMGLN